jgi:MFS transporter, ACS family, hexuronate transporter
MRTSAVESAVPRVLPAIWRQVRWRIVALLFLATVINFVDRQTLSLVAPVLRDAFRLSNTEYGVIVAAFQFGMLVGEFPMGWLMDWIGPRLGLTLAVLSWSTANALHAAARSVMQFRLLRFWLGTSECGNYSGGVKVVSELFPVDERALAVGIFNGGALIGAVIAPPLIVFLMLHWGWRTAFLAPSLMGMGWVALWLAFYRPRSSDAGLSEGSGFPPAPSAERAPRTIDLLRLPDTWGLMLCRMLVGPVFQFYMYWLPEYLFRARGLSLGSIGAFGWVPYLMGDIGSIAGGWLAGALIHRGVAVPVARRRTLMLGAVMCLLGLLVVPTRNPYTAMFIIGVVLLAHTGLSANMFAAISDVFPTNAVARVTGFTGVAGSFSGMLFPVLTGVLVDRVSYTPIFLVMSAMPLAGVVALVTLSNLRPVALASDRASSDVTRRR